MRSARPLAALVLTATALVPTLAGDPAPEAAEDTQEFDCRWDGNDQCGVNIEGMWYVVTFVDGSPEHVVVRPGQDPSVPAETTAP